MGDYQEETELPDHLEGESMDQLAPATVVATRVVKLQGEDVTQVLVQWTGKSAEEATWEDEVTIQS